MARLNWILIFLLLAGCSVEKQISRGHRLIEKHPSILEKYATTDTLIKDTTITVYRDTTIYDTIPGEIQFDTVPVPCPERVISNVARANTRFCKAIAWVAGGKVILKLDQAEVVRKWRLDSAIVERDNYKEAYYTELLKPPPEKETPKWAFVTLVIAIFSSVLLALTLLLRR